MHIHFVVFSNQIQPCVLDGCALQHANPVAPVELSRMTCDICHQYAKCQTFVSVSRRVVDDDFAVSDLF